MSVDLKISDSIAATKISGEGPSHFFLPIKGQCEICLFERFDISGNFKTQVGLAKAKLRNGGAPPAGPFKSCFIDQRP